MSYDEFREKVVFYFKELRPGMLDEEIEVYFDLEENVQFLREQYNMTKNFKKAGITPQSAAYCLFMME